MIKWIFPVVFMVLVAFYLLFWRPPKFTETLNGGEPREAFSPDKLDTRLKILSLSLKGNFYDPKQNRLNYQALSQSKEYQDLLELSKQLQHFDLRKLKSKNEKLAFWINLYNALAVHAILYYQPKESVWDIKGFFDRAAYQIDGYRFSLNDIENGILRANRAPPYHFRKPFAKDDPRLQFALTNEEFDPRIHFALNCGSRSCPPISFYDPGKINEELDLATISFVRGETQIQGNKIIISPIFKWYQDDFNSQPLLFLTKHLDEPMKRLISGKRIVFSHYDWDLNKE